MPRTPQPPNPQNSYLPRLPGVGPEVQRVVQDLWTAVRDSVAQTQSLIERPTWTKVQLDARYSPATIVQALAYGGSNQLNVNGLPGLLLQPQTALIATLTAVPSDTPGSNPLNQTGTVISVNGQLMIYTGTAWVALSVLGSVLQDTHANRVNFPAASYALGVIYHETDRNVYYENTLAGGVNVWIATDLGYAAVTQAGLAAFIAAAPALGVNDTGLRVYISDYKHMLRWTGAAFTFVPNDDGSNYYREADSAPNNGLWHACDGSTVSFLNPDGTLTSKTLVNTTAHYMKVGTAGDGALHAAVAPTFTGAALATHAHELPMCIDTGEVPKDIDYMPETTFGTGSTQNFTSHQLLPLTTSENLPTMLSSAVSAGTPAGTVSTTGEPDNFFTQLWFRQ